MLLRNMGGFKVQGVCVYVCVCGGGGCVLCASATRENLASNHTTV